jgi:hypothetical protein
MVSLRETCSRTKLCNKATWIFPWKITKFRRHMKSVYFTIIKHTVAPFNVEFELLKLMHCRIKQSRIVMWLWLSTGFGFMIGFIGHWIVLFTDNYTVYNYALSFCNLVHYSCLLALSSQTCCQVSGCDNRDFFVSSQALCILLHWGLMRKQLHDFCACTWV